MDVLGDQPEQVPAEELVGLSASEPGEMVRGKPGSRAVALLVDAVAIVVLFVVVAVFVPIACSPFVESPRPFSTTGTNVEAALRELESDDARVGVVVDGRTLRGLGVVVLSGAVGRKSRGSLGLRAGDLELRRGSTLPTRWRVALRWIVPVGVFGMLASTVNLQVAAVVTVGGWALCLAGERRSAYDVLVGVTVVDPVETRRRADAARRRANPWQPPAD